MTHLGAHKVGVRQVMSDASRFRKPLLPVTCLVEAAVDAAKQQPNAAYAPELKNDEILVCAISDFLVRASRRALEARDGWAIRPIGDAVANGIVIAGRRHCPSATMTMTIEPTIAMVAAVVFTIVLIGLEPVGGSGRGTELSSV